ncbi:histidine kinase [Domibacillus sp. DTU_2020_1001157_1_SI_ALB_TIR_016]|uniref:sensor histidine kinase n=1 Tax=Domibacillus sp. DTU_2020_1001157_1_SI_ALB_TIR_016 TaxID=3077789 RepID=UPI0028EDE871|nr:histidine kinase [Domibacillus sp. DTU_2020_1001157_1_SI_ALB_TIR_016]WNS77918.1 histidine kinase [Domibacillus sp. DTU_2020_1001157_1_SI_ALB_TIR_016]
MKHVLKEMEHYFKLTVLNSIQRKLMGTLLLVMMVPLIIFMLISTQISRGTVESSEISSNKSRVELSGSYLEEQIRWYDEFLFDALVDEQLVPSISSVEDINTVNIFNRQSYIKDKLFGLFNGRDDTTSASLVSFEENQLYKVESNDFFVFPYLDSPVPPQNKEAIFGVDQKTGSFSFERYIYRFEDQRAVGKIQINVSFSFMDHIAENLKSNEGEHILLLDSKGNALYNPDHINLTKEFSRQLAEQAEHRAYAIEKENYYFLQPIMDRKLTILKMVPKEVMLTGAVHIGRSGLFILIVSMILTAILSVVVSNQVARPIVSLTKAMERVEETDFRVDMKVERTDEIGILHRKYKEMIDRIRDLIEKNYKRELETRDAQFLALQAQINPHFLYNTLQVIGGMAVKNGAGDIYKMTQKLALMFRYITNKQGDLVPLREEITHLKNYLYIQQVRFGEKISIQLFVDESINEALIPLLSLQPIIENSFKHGFETQVEQGVIKIDIQEIFDEIEITIEDNGAGMSEERLREVRKKLQQEGFSEQRSIGLKNVDARIKLYFGREYGIDVDSENSYYTKVTIRIPSKQKEVAA